VNEWKAYEKCAERIKAKGHGTCEPWSFDYIKCVDKCVRRRVGEGGSAAAAGGRRRRAAAGGTRAHANARANARTRVSAHGTARHLASRTSLLPPPAQAAPKIFATLK